MARTHTEKGLDRGSQLRGGWASLTGNRKIETQVTRRPPLQTLTQSRDRQVQHVSASVCSPCVQCMSVTSFC